MFLSVISPRSRPSLQAVFDLGLQTDEVDAEAAEVADHAFRPGQLAMLQIRVPGEWVGQRVGHSSFVTVCRGEEGGVG